MDFPAGKRAQSNFLAEQERLVLNYLCVRLPLWIVPDHLTALGFFGAFISFCGYVCSRYDLSFLWLASLGLTLHWLGDSLDGSLARHRHCERMKYGYFLDCMTDAFCCLIIMVGLGLSPFVRMDAALFALVGYYLLCIYVFLSHHLNGIHKLSFLGCGPTEMRLGLIGLNIWMFAQGQIGVTVAGNFVSAYDFILILNGVISIIAFLFEMMDGIDQLRDQEIATQTEAENPLVRKGVPLV
jgi:archaetidylinositol phosphate synthase